MAMIPARLHDYEAEARQGHAPHSDARIDVPYERIADFCRRASDADVGAGMSYSAARWVQADNRIAPLRTLTVSAQLVSC